jgi:hypothetical protein
LNDSPLFTTGPACGAKTAIVDVSEILTDSATLSNLPNEERGRFMVHAIYCETCGDILSTRLIDPETGQTAEGRRIKSGRA